MKIPIFYGVKLDRSDPYLRHNLDRLEKRFKERYEASIKKDGIRNEAGKAPHQTILMSITNNKQKILMIKLLKRII